MPIFMKSYVWLMLAAFIGLAPAGATAELQSTMLLWPDGAPGAKGDADKDKPRLLVRRVAGDKATRTALVIYPGGGYGGLAMGHEGHEIAAWANAMGVQAFIVDYRHRGKGYGHPAPMLDAMRAVRIVRKNAKAWGIDEDKIGIMGFSAGGHLASTVGTHFDAGDKDSPDPVAQQSSRPDYMILCYPVIAFDKPYTHRGSQRNLLGADADKQLVASLSNEKQVKQDTPPTFLFHTTADKVAPPENSVAFYLGLREAGVPAEMHVYANGRHGVGLAKSIPGTRSWPDRCKEWLTGLGMLPK